MILIGPTVSMAKAHFVIELEGLHCEHSSESVEMTPRPTPLDIADDEEDMAVRGLREKVASFTVFEDRPPSADVFTTIPDSPPPPYRAPSPPTETSPTRKTGSANAKENARITHDPSQRAAERALVRTLTTLDALGTELRPLHFTLTFSCFLDVHVPNQRIALSQAHVLLRAPRKFNHPAWLPRQAYSQSFDAQLFAFLNGDAPAKGKTVPTIGVRVSCKPLATAEDAESEALDRAEMIWWQWNEKLVGFGDAS